MNTQRLTQVTVGIIALAILAVIIFNRVSSAGPAEIDLSSQPRLGSENASVHVVMFEDFLCPSCATFTEQIFPVVKNEYGEHPEVAFYYVDFPVIPGSTGPATVAECVYRQDNDAFWELYPVFMRSQQQITSAANALELAGEYAPGIDRDELVSCTQDPATLAVVQADGQMAAQAGATGTPSVFVNGRNVSASANAINNAIAAALP